MSSSSRDWSTASSALGHSQADNVPSTLFPGGVGPNQISNLSLIHFNASLSQNRSSDESISERSSRDLTPPDNQVDRTPLHRTRKARAYDRPGKKPAAPYTRDPLELHRHCKRHGGSDFAVDWIMVVFQHDVSLDALVRCLDFTEVERADRSINNGFELRQAYDGFLVKIDHHFECGLCKEKKRTHWVHKKDAIRHLRKFHFGLADQCRMWCVLILLVHGHLRPLIPCYDSRKNFYSTGEMKKHRCKPCNTGKTMRSHPSDPLRPGSQGVSASTSELCS